MPARIRSMVNSINPVDEASRDDLVVTDVVTLSSLDTATTYSWSISYAPEGSTAAFSGSVSAQNPGTFIVDVVGPYLISLTVDLALVTESTQYVRLRAPTSTGLLLVAAGEGVSGAVVIPVDLGAEGWTNEQNANLLALENNTLQKASNLSDLSSIATAKTNLGYVATEIGYTPTTPSNWSPAPTALGGAEDQLASRTNSLETGTLQKASNLSDLSSLAAAKTNLGYVATEIGYTPTTPTDWSPAPTALGGAEDQLASRVTALEAGGGGALVQKNWSGANAIVTANVIAGGATVSADVSSWFDLGLVHRLKIVAASNTVMATFRLYADALQTTLLYEAVAFDAWNSPYEDLVPFHYRDDDATKKLHYTISNSGLSNSIFTITIQGIGE